MDIHDHRDILLVKLGFIGDWMLAAAETTYCVLNIPDGELSLPLETFIDRTLRGRAHSYSGMAAAHG